MPELRTMMSVRDSQSGQWGYFYKWVQMTFGGRMAMVYDNETGVLFYVKDSNLIRKTKWRFRNGRFD